MGDFIRRLCLIGECELYCFPLDAIENPDPCYIFTSPCAGQWQFSAYWISKISGKEYSLSLLFDKQPDEDMLTRVYLNVISAVERLKKKESKE